MIPLVEGFLKQFEENKDMIMYDSNADMPKDVPCEVGISLWLLGGHPDLMPAFFHFLSNEAVYILTFDLSQDLHQLAPKDMFDNKLMEWVDDNPNTLPNTDNNSMTNLDYLLNWINMIYHQSRYLFLIFFFLFKILFFLQIKKKN